MNGSQRFTVVAFHAHPDDEALLTGGTLARAAAEGHRVVLVTATRGDRGLAGTADGTGEELARLRMRELHASARALGCARVVWLGYADSGLEPTTKDPAAFALAPTDEAAGRLAAVLIEEAADVLTTYDRNGGYGHPDHVQVHHVGAAAARIAGTPLVLQATAPARLFETVVRTLGQLRHTLGSTPVVTRDVFSDRSAITHRVDVRRHLRQKRAAMAAHASQGRAAGGRRVLAAVLRLPGPLFRVAFGTEWFVATGPPSSTHTEDDIFAALRTQNAASP